MFQVTLTTRSYEMDSLGHVNNAVYLNYLEHCRMQWLYSHGITAVDFQRTKTYPVVVNININYKRELTDGQQITVTVEEQTRSDRKVVFYQTIIDSAGTLYADAQVTVVWLNHQRQVIPLPVETFPDLFKESHEAQD